MPNDRSVVPRSPGKCSTIPDLLLDVANDSSFWALRDGKDVPDVESRFLAAVDEGTGRKSLGGDEGLFPELVAVGIAEDYCRKWSTAEPNERLDYLGNRLILLTDQHHG